jgi:hypothetical protein
MTNGRAAAGHNETVREPMAEQSPDPRSSSQAASKNTVAMTATRREVLQAPPARWCSPPPFPSPKRDLRLQQKETA